MTPTNGGKQQLLFLGDSDISRWPESLLPFYSQLKPTVSAKNGATLEDVITLARDFLQSDSNLVVVACAGENDIGNGNSISKTMKWFHILLDLVFQKDKDTSIRAQRNLVFLGPKFEPWLNDDHRSREQYVELSYAMQNACQDYSEQDKICYLDCLTMFCGTADGSFGGIFGETNIADKRFFDDDGLHLSTEGYALWKKEVEDQLRCLVLEE